MIHRQSLRVISSVPECVIGMLDLVSRTTTLGCEPCGMRAIVIKEVKSLFTSAPGKSNWKILLHMWGMAEISGTLKTLNAGVLVNLEAIGYTGKGTLKGIMKVKQRVSIGDFL